MPRYSKSEPLAPERVFELDTNSKVLRSWHIPVDSVPYAVQGNDLLFSFNDQIYRVSLQGKLGREATPPERGEPAAAQCRPLKEFQGSAYAQCWRYADLDSKQLRTLAFLGVCS